MTNSGVTNFDSSSATRLPLRVFFNNIQGFISKRALFLSCGITEQYDLFFLQETCVSENRVLIDEWSNAKFRAFNLTTTCSAFYRRGMIAAVRQGILAYPLKVESIDKRFEISAFRVHSSVSYRTFLLAYKSPSMGSDLTEQFFENLAVSAA